MKKYMYKATWTQELEDDIENSISKPLVEEMFYKYGLTVYAKSKEFKNSFIMTMDGLPYCEVYIENWLNIKTGARENIHCYYSEYYAKDRGGDLKDKRTIRSNKMFKLLSTINKKKALMPDHTFLLTSYLLETILGEIKVKIKPHNNRKYIGDIKVSAVEKLLNYAINKTPLSGEELKDYKVILDKWIKLDDDERRTTERVKAMMYNEMYAIAETGDKGFVIASFKVIDYTDSRFVYEIIKPFQRVLSLDDYEHIDEIRPVLTMYKLYKEPLNQSITRYELSNVEKTYIEDLGIVTAFDSYPDMGSYKPLWTFISTVTE